MANALICLQTYCAFKHWLVTSLSKLTNQIACFVFLLLVALASACSGITDVDNTNNPSLYKCCTNPLLYSINLLCLHFGFCTSW